MNSPIKVVESPAQDGKGARKVVATRAIARGECVLEREWMERTTFVIATAKEAEAHVAHTDRTPPEVTFDPQDAEALSSGGSPISCVFGSFKASGHLQMACSLIERHSHIVQQWVKEAKLKCEGPPPPNIPPMDQQRHRVCMNWLKKQGVPLASLLYWAITDHFASLYHMVAYNCVDLEFLLSGIQSGIAFCPVLASFNHDCDPNTCLERMPRTYRMVAQRDIAAGEELCFAYTNFALGLQPLDDAKHSIVMHYGFECRCPTHQGQRPPYRPGKEPRSLQSALLRHKTVATKLQEMKTLVDARRMSEVRALGITVWKRHERVLRREPRLAFAFCSMYAECVTSTPPNDNGMQWMALFEETLARYCGNPMYTVRAYFYTLVETIHRSHVVTVGDLQCLQQDNPNELTTFLNRWMEIRRYLNHTLGRSEPTVNLESHMFNGFYTYLCMLRRMVEQLEADNITPLTAHQQVPRVPEGSVNVTTNAAACALGMVYATAAPLGGARTEASVKAALESLMDSQELDDLLRTANPARLAQQAHKVDDVKSRKRKKKRRPKRAAQDDAEPPLFIPFQDWSSDEEEELFIPVQYDDDDDAPVAVCAQ